MTIRTSVSDPILVGVLPTCRKGRLSLTLAPGKHQSSKEGGYWRRDLALDLDRLAGQFETHVLVCLLGDDELDRLNIRDYMGAAGARGLEVLRLPIQDGGLAADMSEVEAVVKRIGDLQDAGKNVVVHCAGGLGRAGTIGGCCLVAEGMSVDEVFGALKEARGKHCPENDRQKSFIVEFAARCA